MATLVQRLKQIDAIPPFVEVDKGNEALKLFEEARREYPIVDEALSGRISMFDVVNKMYDKYRGWRVFLPRFRDNQYDAKLDDLKLDEIICANPLRTDTPQRLSKVYPYLGEFIGWFYDKIANPIAAPLLTGTIVAFLSGGQGRFENEIANYSANFGVGALAGLIVGIIGSVKRYQDMAMTRDDVAYLHRRIQEINSG